MNRFSPKQTLSNITTAVRETVDSVNKIAVATALLLSAMIFSNVAIGQSSPVTLQTGAANNGLRAWTPEQTQAYDSNVRAQQEADQKAKLKGMQDNCGGDKAYSEECAQYKAVMGISMPVNSQCDRYSSELSKALDRVNDSCGSIDGSDIKQCVTKVGVCVDAEKQVNEYNEESESESESTDYCDSALANKCPALPSFMSGRDFKADKKDAESERKDAKKELDDLMDDDRKNKADLAKQQLDIQEQQQNGVAAFQDAQDKLSKKMEESLEGISTSSKKSFDDAQTAANAMEVEYVKMRADARTAADAVTQAQDNLQVTCRAAAEKKYSAAEAARIAADKKGRQNLGTAISGAAKRKTSTVLRQQAIDFQKYFSECTGGVSAEGVNAKNQIQAAQRAKDSADKLMADKAALIEKQRAQMQSKLQQMETDASNAKSKVVEDTQKALQKLSDDKTRVDQQNQQRMALMASNNLQANLSMQNKIADANQRLMKTQTEAALASTRMSCAGRNARRSETQQDKSSKAYGSAVGDVRSFKNICESANRMGCKPLPTECTAAMGLDLTSPIKSKDRYPLKEGPTKH